MVFSSMTFLCVFLPVVLLLYYAVRSVRAKNGLLIVASLVFYAYGEPIYILLMLFSIFLNYLLGRMLTQRKPSQKKWILTIAVVVNIGLLFVFKYSSLFLGTFNQITGLDVPIPGFELPVGISFYTFQALSYVIDVYRGDVEAEHNFFHVMLYISFFPQLIAGPIVKYHDIHEQIRCRRADPDEIAEGVRRFIIGLSKKVLISNTMASVADTFFSVQTGELNVLSAWTAAAAYLFQIYFDFSGYSDMAIGLGHMFGFSFRENFNYPYIADSIQDFWRRWHISLSTWFKEYLYIPLGGNRKGKHRTILNKWIVFCATGLWHGANWTFLIWGMWHGMWITLETVIPVKRFPKWIRHIYTIVIVTVGFVIFRADTLTQGVQIIARMFSGWEFSSVQMNLWMTQMDPLCIITLIVSVIGSTPWLKKILTVAGENEKSVRVCETAGYAVSIGLLFLCMLSLSGGGYNPFIYFRF